MSCSCGDPVTDQSRRASKWNLKDSTGLDRDLELISYSSSNIGDFLLLCVSLSFCIRKKLHMNNYALYYYNKWDYSNFEFINLADTFISLFQVQSKQKAEG